MKARNKELEQRHRQAQHDAEINARAAAALIAARTEVETFKHLMNGEATPELLAKLEERAAKLDAEAQAAATAATESRDAMQALKGAEENNKYLAQWG